MCIGFLESATCSSSDVYAAFLYVRVYINETFILSQGIVGNDLIRRGDCIYSTVYALPFFCCPFYFYMRCNVDSICGASVIKIRNGNISTKPHNAISFIAYNESQDQIFCTTSINFQYRRNHCWTASKIIFHTWHETSFQHSFHIYQRDCWKYIVHQILLLVSKETIRLVKKVLSSPSPELAKPCCYCS